MRAQTRDANGVRRLKTALLGITNVDQFILVSVGIAPRCSSMGGIVVLVILIDL